MNQFKHLFAPIRMGRMELKNRLKLTPMGMGYCPGMRVSQQQKSFYHERARGGVGLIGLCCTPSRLEEDASLPGIYSDEFIPELRELVVVCSAYGAKVYCQLVAPYGWAFGSGPVEWVSPSGITVDGKTRPSFQVGLTPAGPQPRALTVDEIHEMVAAMGNAALRARQAGFDAVEIIASSGYTLSQFLSPLTNKRTDEYGGSLENRVRIFVEMVESIKRSAGEDYTITTLVSPQHAEGGYSMDELKAFAAALEKAGVDGFCTRPGWHDDRLEMLQMTVPQGSWVHIAEELKKAVSVPVSAGARITDPLLAERVLAEGRADLVYMGRALIADPELPNKAREGRLDEIRPCIGCMRCYDQVPDPVRCSVNPRVGLEATGLVEPATQARKVLVVGGGPAGMEAAAVAAERGHRVTLVEKGSRLGGQLLLATEPPHKEDLSRLTKYLSKRLDRLGVDVVLGRKADVGSVQEIQADAVVLATGAVPLVPGIPGVDRDNVVTAFEVLSGEKEVGTRVVVVGGGMVGCETSEFLVEKGKRVTILEMLKRIGNDIGPATRRGTLMRLKNGDVRMETGVRVEEIVEGGVRGNRDGQSEFFEADSVVLAMGTVPEARLAAELEGRVAELRRAGDCVEPKRIMEAIESGFEVGRTI